MSTTKMKLGQWIELLRTTGLDEEMMQKLHHQFENNYPMSHQSFLEWLDLTEEEIQNIRKWANSEQSVQGNHP